MNPDQFLFSFMDTNVPGFRQLSVGSTTIVVNAGYYPFIGYVVQLNTQLSASTDWTVSFSFDTGKVTFDGSAASDNLTFDDRMGSYLGFQVPATYSLTAGGSYTSHIFPPGLVALHGAHWESVDIRRERILETTRHGRGFGYVWGGAKVWRWKLIIHPGSIQWSETGPFSTAQPSLSGFVTGGKVQLQKSGLQANIGATQTGGLLQGSILAFDRIAAVSAAGYTSYSANLLVCQ